MPSTQEIPRCICASTRRTARLLTRLYDQALRPAGINSVQFELLSLIQSRPNIDQKSLASTLETDQTTLSRNLKLLITQKWIAQATSQHDSRSRTYSLNRAGASVLQKAQISWNEIHHQMQQSLAADWAPAHQMQNRIRSAANAL